MIIDNDQTGVNERRMREMDMYGFYMGRVFDAYEYLGAHPTGNGVVFRTYAPNAAKVSLLHNQNERPMQPVYDGNFYEFQAVDAKPGDLYEYRIYQQNGSFADHSDPYGFQMELRPDHRSLVLDRSGFVFHDSAWMKKRSAMYGEPLNIYEIHLGSWRKKADGSWYRYDELAEPLAAYLKESGYNYVEFMPISEHPSDESWGYQNTGFFAPTSRYGTPDQLKQLIDTLHRSGIGVLLDYVPVHFALDPYGLAQYDGSALYEYPHQDVGVSEWGSYNFMHSRGEVRGFLQSAADYWLREYHFDGLRMDAISRIIYWQGDEKRGENGNAVDFIKVMNRGLKERHPGCILIAEDSTSYPNVTLAIDRGGLGFDYKWDMGWMHDTLEYFQASPAERIRQYHKLTFSMMYFYRERYLLPFSHDEVVHGKATILNKMNGGYEGIFPQARGMYLYMMVHPGKKLNFMGNEIGQFREWDEKREQDWSLRNYPAHDAFYTFMTDLNKLYLSHSALWAEDYTQEGFRWLDCLQEEKCVYILERRSEEETLIAAFNFGSREQSAALPSADSSFTILLDTDWEKYGGVTPEQQRKIRMQEGILALTLAPFSGVLLSAR